jgi:hypothetical protein
MDSLAAALSQLDGDLWRKSASGQDTIVWLPLWLISQSGLWIGLARDGRWAIGRPSGQVAAATQKMAPGWLPLLDHDESVVKEEISDASAKYNLPVDSLLQSLPIDGIIRVALTGSNAHWIDRALIWLESRTIPEDIYELLPRVSSSKVAGQRARQRAWRLMKRRSDQ